LVGFFNQLYTIAFLTESSFLFNLLKNANISGITLFVRYIFGDPRQALDFFDC